MSSSPVQVDEPGKEWSKQLYGIQGPVSVTVSAYVIKIGAGDDVLIVISHRKFNGLASGSKFIEYK